MADEFIKALFTNVVAATVSNTTTPTTLVSNTISGGSLLTSNKFRWQMQGEISFAGANTCTLSSVYGGETVSTCTVASNGAASNIGVVVNVEISGNNSVNSQYGTIHSLAGLAKSNDASTPTGLGSVGVGSGSNQLFELIVAWDSASASNSISHIHSAGELISYTEETPNPNLDEPTAYVFLSSRLNNLRYTLRKYVYFYAPLEHELTFYGYKSVTFTRAGASTATWRDGASHTVAANEPRFEYSGETVSGFAFTTGEALTYDTDNSLDDSNTICWLFDGVYKSTARGDTNPFNASGSWTGGNGHIMHIVKFNKVLTAAEDNEVEVAIS